jgi:predicted nucleotide-binding protein
MLDALKDYGSKEAEMALSSLTRALLPAPDQRPDNEQIEGLPMVEQKILREVSARLGLETEIPSQKDIPAVLDFLSRELSDVVLSRADVQQLQSATFERDIPRSALKEARKPLILISSSAEGLEYAKIVQQQVGYSAFTELWTEKQINIGDLQNLIRNAGRFDFAVFVLTPHDFVRFEGTRASIARTNIAFEAGFFVGKLGADRTFFFTPDTHRNLPSDLAGTVALTYNPDLEPTEGLGPAINSLVHYIQRFGSIGSKGLHWPTT